MSKSRRWCYTLNNYSQDEVEELLSLDVHYHVMGFEEGEEGTPHLQGFIIFKNARYFNALKKILSRAHWEETKGTSFQAAEYCMKDKQFEEVGCRPHEGEAGRREDLYKVADAVKAGTFTPAEFPVTYIKYNKGIAALQHALTEHRTEAPTACWLWGLSGRGKTELALSKCGAENSYIKDSTKWWDGYHQQQAIIVDDFRPDNWEFADLLRFLDRTAYQKESKGGWLKINSPYVFFTSAYPPSRFWSGNDYEQIVSRFSYVIEVTGENLRQVKKPTVFSTLSNFDELPF